MTIMLSTSLNLSMLRKMFMEKDSDLLLFCNIYIWNRVTLTPYSHCAMATSNPWDSIFHLVHVKACGIMEQWHMR